MKKFAKNGGKRKMSDIFRIMLCILFFTAAFYFAAPVFFGIVHIGTFYPTVIFLILSLCFAFPKIPAFFFSGKIKPFSIIACVLVGLFLIGVLSTLVAMGVSSAKRPQKDADVTVIVLGCQVRGTEPSVMLNERINAAFNYLSENENAKCIASGGKGSGEEISEAECIKQGLVSRGISQERIFIEDRSESTAQNLEYSAKIISENGMSENVAIASDNFHQLRASIFAGKNGLSAYSIGCPTFWPLSCSYWAREVIGVASAIVRGY